MTSIIQQMWVEVDECLDRLAAQTGPNGAHNTEHLKGQLSGMTRMIQIISLPYYPTHEDAKREAVARHAAKLAGEYHMTPGCETITILPNGTPHVNAGEHVPTPWERDHRSVPVPTSGGGRSTHATPAQRGSTAPAKHFTTDEVAKIRAAHAAGFDVTMLAAANKCTEGNIKAVLLNV